MYSHCSPGSVRAWGSGSWAGRLGLGLDTLDRMLGHARCTHRILQTHPLSDLSFPSILLDLQNTILISMKIKHWLILTFAESANWSINGCIIVLWYFEPENFIGRWHHSELAILFCNPNMKSTFWEEEKKSEECNPPSKFKGKALAHVQTWWWFFRNAKG